MSETLSLKMETTPDLLTHITTAVEGLAGRENWSPELTFRINLVLEELGLNIMNHGYGEGIHEFDLKLISEEDALTVEIVDSGRPFDPLNDAPPPNLDLSIDNREAGGLGIHLVRTMMDELCYQRKRGRNHLTLVTRRVR